MKNSKFLKFTKLETKQMSNIKGGGSGQPGAASRVRIRGNGSI